MDRSTRYVVACFFALVSCAGPDAVLLTIGGDAPAEQYDLYVRDDATQKVIFHSGFNPVQAAGEPPRDITQEKLKVALKLTGGGQFTLLVVGVIGATTGGKPAVGARQMFWAGRVQVAGTTYVDARLLTVPEGDDADRDLWPDANDFLAHVPEAATLYQGRAELLDCNDKTDHPANASGQTIMLPASEINPFAVEICNDGYDENCNGDADEPCVDEDMDGDFFGSDCDDQDPNRHRPNPKDPFPDPPNCCGYNLGKTTEPERSTNYLGDPLLCPTKRCEDGVDNACQGGDTRCVVDEDCDGDVAPFDCNDHDPSIKRSAQGGREVCGNDVDEDCDGVINNGCVPCDLDGDGYQRMDAANGCPDASDEHPGQVDCNDYDSGVHPGATGAAGGREGGMGTNGMLTASVRGYCRRIYEPTGTTGTPKVASFAQQVGDADCDGEAFRGCPPPSCDVDGDGWPNANTPECNPNNVALDCDDNDPTTFPGAPDKCDTAKLENCASAVPCGTQDKDGDGYTAAFDCDDNNPARHPWAVELCNGIDDDCDGLVDEGNPDPTGKPLVAMGAVTQCTTDNDGECGKAKGACVCSSANNNAKDDPNGNRTFCPGETMGAQKPPRCFGAGQPKMQTCDAVAPKDDDCDGRDDDPAGDNLAVKGQPCGISVGQCKAGTVIGCDKTKQNLFVQFGRRPAAEAWYVCSSETVYPKPEACNGFDDDCNGELAGTVQPPQPGTSTIDERDHDGDKYLACAGCNPAALAPGLLGCGDCDDGRAATRPGAPEMCNNIDDDCVPDNDGKDECVGATPTCCSSQTACRNLTNDFNNCTACGTPCDPLKANQCGGAGCMCGGAAACGTGQWCSGGACTPCNDNAHCGPTCVDCGAGAVCKDDASGCTQCNNDNDCAPNQYCQGGSCRNKRNNGQTCNTSLPNCTAASCNQCLSGYCVDGRCCDESPATCTGCRQCNTGVCGNVPAGSDPNNVCNANLASCLGANCNGNGSCALPNNTACGTSCVGSTLTGSLCTNGSCQAQTGVPCPDNFACATPTACRTACSEDGHCAAGYYCANPTCVKKKAQGETCAGNSQCENGRCVDGVCCATASCPTCHECALVTGTCTAVTSGDDDDSCTGDNTCNAAGQCRLKTGKGCSSPAECATGFCVGGVCCSTACNGGMPSCMMNSRIPNTCGGGTCNTTPIDCTTGYTCNAGVCATSCTCPGGSPCNNMTQCATGFYCDGAACQDKKADSSACNDPVECESGKCEMNVCEP